MASGLADEMEEIFGPKDCYPSAPRFAMQHNWRAQAAICNCLIEPIIQTAALAALALDVPAFNAEHIRAVLAAGELPATTGAVEAVLTQEGGELALAGLALAAAVERHQFSGASGRSLKSNWTAAGGFCFLARFGASTCSRASNCRLARSLSPPISR